MGLFHFLRPSYLGNRGYTPLRESLQSSTDSSESDEVGEKEASAQVVPVLAGVRSWLWTVPGLAASLLRVLGSTLIFLLPSFLVRPLRHYIGICTKDATEPQRAPALRSTAYLDGLRGVAALIVYIFHYTYLWYPELRHGYGSTEDDNWFWQRTIIRVLHSGRASVTIFFIISGYVLSFRTVNFIHRGQHDKALDSLVGSLFRRPFRLYLPIIAFTGIAAVMVRYGVYVAWPRQAIHPPFVGSALDQFRHWLATVQAVTYPFRTIAGRNSRPYSNVYAKQLWTIPVEFKGSLEVFLFLLAFARARRWIRLLSVASIGVYWQVATRDFDQGLFCIGLLLAELSLICPPETYRLPQGPSRFVAISPRWLWLLRHIVTLTLFCVALHFCSYPENNGPTSPGFITMSAITPEYYRANETWTQFFWQSVGSVMIMFALMYSPPLRASAITAGGAGDTPQLPLTNSPAAASGPSAEPLLQRMFTNRVAQYLGDISYSLYLCHLTANTVVGVRCFLPANAARGKAAASVAALTAAGQTAEAEAAQARLDSAYAGAFVWGMVWNTLALLWMSDVFARAVDGPVVKLTRKIWLWTSPEK